MRALKKSTGQRSPLLAGTAALLIFIAAIMPATADECNVQGYVNYFTGNPVPAGTPVNITNINTGVTYPVVTGFGWDNFYFKAITCTQSPPDTISAVSTINQYLTGSNSGSASAQLELNITYQNNPPSFNASLPNHVMDEDNTTGIDNAANLSTYVQDYENQSISYSIASQSNPSLVTASIDGAFIDISAPAANMSGSSTVCVRAYDGYDYSPNSCFSITVNPVPDLPVMSIASVNASGWVRGGATAVATAVASDVDGENVILYVCASPTVGPLGCAPGFQRCTSTAASNPSCSFTIEYGVAARSWFAYIIDSVTGSPAANNFSGSYSSDGTAPIPGSVTIEGGASYHDSVILDIGWSGFSDTGSGIQYYYYSYDDGSGTASGTAVDNTTTNRTMNDAQEGLNAVYVWASDSVGNIGDAASDLIMVDTGYPIFSGWAENPVDLRVNHTGTLTVSLTVTDITLDASDQPALRYRFLGGVYGGWNNMTQTGGSGTTRTYSYEIDETWQDHEETWLYYEVMMTDVVGHMTNETRSEYIEIENYVPIFTQLSGQSGTEDTNLSFTIIAEDIDEQLLTFSASIDEINFIRLDNYSAIAWWVPTNEYVGQNTVTISVFDGISLISQDITITIAPANDLPILQIIGDLYAYYHTPFLYYFYAVDVDNNNTDTSDDDNLTFYNENGLSWLEIDDRFNASNGQYYGVLNFTPLLSHQGTHNVTVSVFDGTAADSEEIVFTVGYCGDKDSGGEPRCDSEYEDCSNCPSDCGECEAEGLSYLAIITDPRNCFGGNFTFTTYELYDRATCETEGLIIQGREVCGNLSRVGVKVYLLENRQWEEVDQYISDDDGVISFIPEETGEYKLEARKSGYPNAFKYLEINPCLAAEENQSEERKNITRQTGEEKEPETQEPTSFPALPRSQDGPSASMFSIIFAYVVVPALAILFITLSYYYYENNKNDVAWLLKLRISTAIYRQKLAAWLALAWRRLLDLLGFG